MQSFFNNARIGAVCTTVIYFGSSMSFVMGENASAGSKIVNAFSPTTCMSSIVKVIIGFESNGLGVTLGNLNRDFKNFSVLKGLWVQVFNFFWLSLLGLYFEQVLPREFGTRQGWCFCCRYCKKKKQVNLV